MDRKNKQTDLLAEAHGLTLHDVRMTRHQLERATCAREAYGYTDGMRTTDEDLAELFVSVAFTTSLIGYLRDGEGWSLDLVSPTSHSAKLMIADLDAIRENMLRLEPSTWTYMRRPEVAARAKIAASILILALEGCTDEIRPLLCAITSVRPVGDPQGDAQLIAENHFGNPEIPAFTEATEKDFPGCGVQMELNLND